MPVRGSVKEAISRAQRELAAESKERLVTAWRSRYKDKHGWLAALLEWSECQFWREEDYTGQMEAIKDTFGKHAKEVVGWLTLLQVPEKARDLVADRCDIRKLGVLRGVLTRQCWKPWVTLAMFLNFNELVSVASEYRRQTKGVTHGAHVFVPMWVPMKDYKELFYGKEGEPVWATVSERLARAVQLRGKGHDAGPAVPHGLPEEDRG